MVAGFDITALEAAVARHGTVARVLVTRVRGSAPREAGTSMLVWPGGQAGTIGGGALEHQATQAALALLAGSGAWRRQAQTLALGPGLGQCCGGSVDLLTEVYGPAELAAIDRGAPGLGRPLRGGFGPAPALVPSGPGTAGAPPPLLGPGQVYEAFAGPALPVWIWGAGHVGRELALITARMHCAVTLIDIAPARLPDPLPEGVSPLVAAQPATLARHAPALAHHYVMTHSHALDLEICHAVLSGEFGHLGLIGSATKAARFARRLSDLGHPPARLSRLECPIGDPGLGRAPIAIALGIATAILTKGVRSGASMQEQA